MGVRGPTAGHVFDVQVKYSGQTGWTNLVAATAARAKAFTPLVPSPYAVRARARDAANGPASNWSSTVTLTGNWSMFIQADGIVVFAHPHDRPVRAAAVDLRQQQPR